MDVLQTRFPEAKVIVPRVFADERGVFLECWNRLSFELAGISCDFVQDNYSVSHQIGTLRGLHFQAPPVAQAKLVRCARGRIMDVIVDIRHGSPTFGRYLAEEISAMNRKQIFVPKGFAHGFVTLDQDTEVTYKVDAYYAQALDCGIAWDDEDIGIDWPLPASGPVLSPKDRNQPRLRDLPRYFSYAQPSDVADVERKLA
jgi:dTDP-4-dehydrorhamnose 3,5-epimerase